MSNHSKISNIIVPSSSGRRRFPISNFKPLFSYFHRKLLVTLGLIMLALCERLWFDLGPNVELVTLTTFLAAFYVGRKLSLVVPLATLALSDILLGNTSIMLFTWTAYLIIAVVAGGLSLFKRTGWQKVLLATGGGVAGSLWFYLWTNFGVWLLDSWRMYPNDFSGLSLSYLYGLPFLKYQLVSNLIFLSIGFSVVETISLIMHNLVKKTQFIRLQHLMLGNSVSSAV